MRELLSACRWCHSEGAFFATEESRIGGVETLTALARGASVADAQGDILQMTCKNFITCGLSFSGWH
jgi:hypothetical protein